MHVLLIAAPGYNMAQAILGLSTHVVPISVPLKADCAPLTQFGQDMTVVELREEMRNLKSAVEHMMGLALADVARALAAVKEGVEVRFEGAFAERVEGWWFDRTARFEREQCELRNRVKRLEDELIGQQRWNAARMAELDYINNRLYEGVPAAGAAGGRPPHHRSQSPVMRQSSPHSSTYAAPPLSQLISQVHSAPGDAGDRRLEPPPELLPSPVRALQKEPEPLVSAPRASHEDRPATLRSPASPPTHEPRREGPAISTPVSHSRPRSQLPEVEYDTRARPPAHVSEQILSSPSTQQRSTERRAAANRRHQYMTLTSMPHRVERHHDVHPQPHHQHSSPGGQLVFIPQLGVDVGPIRSAQPHRSTQYPAGTLLSEQQSRSGQIANRGGGVIVQRVVRGAALDRQGVLPGDSLTHFNDEPIMDASHLQDIIGRSDLRAPVRLAVVPSGRPASVPLVFSL